jgi:hypothetical protein
MTYETQIQNLLYNDVTIQSLVTSYVYETVINYCVFKASLLPKSLDTDSDKLQLTVDETTINHYRSEPVSGGQTIIHTAQFINCRAKTQSDAEALQEQAHIVLNRIEVDRGFFKSIKLPVIKPADDADNYNCPLEIRVTTY